MKTIPSISLATIFSVLAVSVSYAVEPSGSTPPKTAPGKHYVAGSASIGGAAKKNTGINGTGIKPKH